MSVAPTAEQRISVLTSADGSTIGYSSVGGGPSVIVVPGALSTAATYGEFARQLAGSGFLVHVIERRGRGASGPQRDDYGIAKERDDVLALQERTRASYLVGHSYGGLIALEAARGNSAFAKVAVYEPGVSIGGSIPVNWISLFEQRLAAGQPLDALAVFSLAAGPARARRTPRWLMRLLLPHVVGKEALAELLDLLPTTIREHRELARLDGSVVSYREISASVLLMSGGRSGLSWVETAFSALTETLPRSERLEFAKLDHFGIDKRAPAEVAKAVAGYFLKGTTEEV
jgi:pimeloyl-ACP methyl ester carboxylesterase